MEQGSLLLCKGFLRVIAVDVFEGFIIYIFLCFSKGAYEAVVPAGRLGG